MTTKDSPADVLGAQALRVAKHLKKAERGDNETERLENLLDVALASLKKGDDDGCVMLLEEALKEANRFAKPTEKKQ